MTKRKYQAFYILPEILNQYQVKCPLKIYPKKTSKSSRSSIKFRLSSKHNNLYNYHPLSSIVIHCHPLSYIIIHYHLIIITITITIIIIIHYHPLSSIIIHYHPLSSIIIHYHHLKTKHNNNNCHPNIAWFNLHLLEAKPQQQGLHDLCGARPR